MPLIRASNSRRAGIARRAVTSLIPNNAESQWPLRINMARYVDATTATTVRNENNKTRRTIISGLKLKHLAEINHPAKLAAVFEKILDRHIPDREHSLYVVSVNHPGFNANLGKFCLWKFNRDGEILNNGVAIVKNLEMLAQSNASLNPEDPFTLEIMILEKTSDPQMTSRGVGRSRGPGDLGLLVNFVVNNDDGLCLPKAAAVALANGELNHLRNLYNISNIRKMPPHIPQWIAAELQHRMDSQSALTTLEKYQNEEQKERAIKKRDDHQKREALLLLDYCQIPSDKPSYTLEDLKTIYEKQPCPPWHKGDFPLFSFHIFTPDGALIRAFRDPSQHNNQYPLLFIHDNDHLDYAFNLNHLNFRFCKICKLAHKRCEHRCKGQCSLCQSHIGECEEVPGEKQQCKDCLCLFPNKTCLEAHKQTAATSAFQGASLCTRRKFCPKCSKMYHVDSSEPHKCFHRYCDKCEEVRPLSHSCSWRSFRKTELKKIKEQCSQFKFVFYDFETMQGDLDDNDTLHPFESGHIPILARAAVVCNLCENLEDDKPCENCGDQRELKFLYEPGQPKSKVVDDFIMHFLGNRRYNDYTMLAHYASGFDILPIMAHLFTKAIKPHAIHSGTRVIQMTIDRSSFNFSKARKLANGKKAIKNPIKARLIFKDTLLFTTCGLEAFPKAFGIEEQKGWFPFDLISDKYWNYNKKEYPDFKFWKASERFKKEKSDEIRRWYESVKDSPFNFKEELDKYCRNDVIMLKKGILKFRTAFIQENSFDPFQQCMTAASASQLAFRLNHLPDPNLIAHIDERGEPIRDNQSGLALRFLHWKSEKENIYIRTALAEEGEMRLRGASSKTYKVDGYVPETHRVIEVHGCYWHGCGDCNQFLPSESKRVEMADRLANTKAKIQDIRDAGYDVEEIWEHEIEEMLENDNEMRRFFDEYEYEERLFPRKAFFGGRTFTSKMVEKCGPLEEIKFFDVNSLYPAMMYLKEYPLGRPEILKLARKQISADVDPLLYKGLITCTVLVDQDVRFSVLPVRCNGQLYFGNCYTCIVTEQQYNCEHSDEERVIGGTWSHMELAEAVKQGAKILKTTEIWHWKTWSQRGQLFGDFVRKFYRMKIANSGWNESLKTDADKAVYLSELSARMGIELAAEEVRENPTLRQLAKILLNSGYGKFGERTDRTTTTYMSDRGEIESLLRDRSCEIKECHWIPSSLDVVGDVDNGSTWMIRYKTRKSYKHSARFGNIVLASFITAYARLEILRHIQKVGEAHIYTDTDSIAFKVTKGDGVLEKLKEDIHLHLGGLSDEIKEEWKITRFVAPSAKCYGYEMENRLDPSQKKNVMKIRGVYLTEDNQGEYPFEKFLLDVEEYVKDVGEEKLQHEKNYEVLYADAIINGEDPNSIPWENPLKDGKEVHTFRNGQIRRKRHALVSETVEKRLKINQHKGLLDPSTGAVYPLGYVPKPHPL